MTRPSICSSTIARLLGFSLLASSPAVSQVVELDPASLYTSSPSVAAWPGGQFLAVWTRDRRVPLSFGPDYFVPEAVAWQRRKSDGRPAAAVGIALPESAGGAARTPRVAATASGTQLVWGRILNEAFVIEGRAAKGGRLQPTRTLGGCPSGTLRGLRLVPAAQGSWLLWNEVCDGLRIVALRLDGSGRPSGDARVLVPPAALPGAEFDVASLGREGFALTWVQSVAGDYGDERVLLARAHRGNGKPKTAPFRVSPEAITSTPGRPPFQPAIVASEAGGLRVAWPRLADQRLVTRDFRIDGTPMGSERSAGDVADVAEDTPRWAATTLDGPRVLLWQRNRAEPDAGCYARRIGARGPQGPEVLVAARCQEVSAAISRARLLVTWQEPDPLPGDNGIPYSAVARSIALNELR